MSPVIDKLLFVIDRCQSEPVGYSLFSSQLASNVLFHCTYNVKSAQPLVDCGAVNRMLRITKKLLIKKDSDTHLRYSCRNLKCCPVYFPNGWDTQSTTGYPPAFCYNLFLQLTIYFLHNYSFLQLKVFCFQTNSYYELSSFKFSTSPQASKINVKFYQRNLISTSLGLVEMSNPG